MAEKKLEILKDKGKPITIFGYEYHLMISLKTLSRIHDALGPLEKLMLNYETIPVIIALCVKDYCEKHPDAPDAAADPAMLSDYMDAGDIIALQPYVQELLSTGAKNA